MVYGSGFENRRRCKLSEGSNPFSSAEIIEKVVAPPVTGLRPVTKPSPLMTEAGPVTPYAPVKAPVPEAGPPKS